MELFETEKHKASNIKISQNNVDQLENIGKVLHTLELEEEEAYGLYISELENFEKEYNKKPTYTYVKQKQFDIVTISKFCNLCNKFDEDDFHSSQTR